MGSFDGTIIEGLSQLNATFGKVKNLLEVPTMSTVRHLPLIMQEELQQCW